MATLFPDRHFHVGGDEISGADWKANPRVQEFMKTNGLMTLGELESYFFDRVRQGKRINYLYSGQILARRGGGRCNCPRDAVL
jgi:glycosyl hydrolase family 20